MRHSPFHPDDTPRPPVPPQPTQPIGLDRLPTPPPSPNDLLASPHDVAPTQQSTKERGTPRPEAMQRTTEEHVGPLAVGQSADADRTQPGVRVAAGEASASEPQPDVSPPPKAHTQPKEGNAKTVRPWELPDDSPFKPRSVRGTSGAELEAAEDRPLGWDQEPTETANLEVKFIEREKTNPKKEITTRDAYAGAIAGLRECLRNPYYYGHTRFDSSPEAQAKARARPDRSNYFRAFHGERHEVQWDSHFGKLRDAGTALTRHGKITPEYVVPSVRIIIQESAELIKAMVPVQEGRLTAPSLAAGGPHAMLLKRELHDINKEGRPAEVAAYKRLAIPRFAWHAHACPIDLVLTAYQDRLTELWTPRNVRDANYLIHPDEVTQNKTPLHKAIEVSRAVAADGYPDEAYAIRSRVIATALRNDKERYEYEPGVFEVPFFQFLFAASITGEVGGPGPGSINYAAICEDVMTETWDRFAAETREGVAGPATNFLREVTEIHNSNEHMVPFFGLSLTQKRVTTNHDIPAVIRGLQQFQVVHGPAITRYITELPNRPVLTNDEAAALATEHLQVLNPATNTSESASQALAAIGGEADMYGFRRYIAETDASTVLVTGDVDMTTHLAYATLEYRIPGSTRRLPITVDIASGVVTPDTVDAMPFDVETAAFYRAAIEAAITKEVTAAEAKAAEMAALAARRDNATLRMGTIESSLPEQAKRHEPRTKTRGEADPNILAETLPDTAQDIAEATGHIQLEDVTAADISGMLKAGQASDLNPDRVLERIRGKVANANQTNTPIGKHTRLVSAKEADRNAIKIRQINWVIEGGRQIRIYLEVMGNGKVRVCGIYDKKGDQHQDAYLKKLAKSIHNRSRSNAADSDTPRDNQSGQGRSKNKKRR